jgi:hypothetical protein
MWIRDPGISAIYEQVMCQVDKSLANQALADLPSSWAAVL